MVRRIGILAPVSPMLLRVCSGGILLHYPCLTPLIRIGTAMNRLPIASLAAIILTACQAFPQSEPGDTVGIEAIVSPNIWREIAPENLLLINTDHGQIVVELNPDFAPAHVAQFQKLATDGTYTDSHFYRVIDAFVAQGGLFEEDIIATIPSLKNENDRPLSEGEFAPLGNADMFAESVGHIDGFPVAQDTALGREWLLHCPGAMAMARDTDPDSGGTEFYIVLDAQRYLDRNLTVFGRVISGMHYVQKLRRGDRAIESGVIQPPEDGDKINSIQLASQLDPSDRPTFRVMNTQTPEFEEAKTAKRVRSDPFFYRTPPEILDICGFEVPVEQIEN